MYKGYLLILLVFLGGCGTSETTKDKHLRIAVAASAQFAFGEMAESFQEKYKVSVDIIVGSSGQLTTQILNGAPFDIYFAANLAYPQIIVDRNKSIGEVETYGYGVPVLWSNKEDYLFGDSINFEKLLSTRRVAIANPTNAPYGKLAQEFMNDTKLLPILKDRLVYGESISQVNEYIINQSVDFGFSAKSIVLSPKLEGVGQFISLSEKYWIEQGMILIENENILALKKKFISFVKSKQGNEILRKYGFAVK